MEAIDMSASTAGAAIAPATPPQVMTTPPVATPAPASSSFSNGGIVDTLKNLNWIQVGFGVLGSTALFFAIYYFRYNIKMTKSFVSDVENKIDELDIKYADMASVLNKQEKEKNASGDKGKGLFI